MSEMQKVVLDTNLLVSALWTENGNAAAIIKLIPTLLIPCYNDTITGEYAEVLSRDKFAFSASKREALLSRIKEFGITVSPDKSTIALLDEDDRIFYDTARASGALLITGNIRHYPDEPFIKTFVEFLRSVK